MCRKERIGMSAVGSSKLVRASGTVREPPTKSAEANGKGFDAHHPVQAANVSFSIELESLRSGGRVIEPPEKMAGYADRIAQQPHSAS